MKNPFLIGETVYLRAIEREDAPIFLPWANDFDVAKHMLVHRPMSLTAEEAWIARIQEDKSNVVLTIVLRKDDRVIGNTALHGIHSHNHHASFGIMIGDKREWGKGYGTEATRLIVGHGFHTLNLHRIWLHVYEDNPRAIRSYVAQDALAAKSNYSCGTSGRRTAGRRMAGAQRNPNPARSGARRKTAPARGRGGSVSVSASRARASSQEALKLAEAAPRRFAEIFRHGDLIVEFYAPR